MPNDRWPAAGALISMLSASQTLADVSFHNFARATRRDHYLPIPHALPPKTHVVQFGRDRTVTYPIHMCLDALDPASTPYWVQWQPVRKAEPEPLTLCTCGWQKEVTTEEVVVMFHRLRNLQSLHMSQNNHGYLYALTVYPKSLSKSTELPVRHTDLPILKLYLSQRPNPKTFKIFYYADPDNQKPSEAATLESMYQEFDLELKHWRWTED
ncbi:hypothetical protein DFH09DRAFT_1093149 [Mycena vulgaris]|nr:hypothetical protein DFH09DRAFT_1093149 [Mycena vulgaris]